MPRFRSSQADRTRAELGAFYGARIDGVLERHLNESLEAHVLAHFRSVANDVPAYARFLDQQGIERESIQSLDDFASLPVTTKDNYHRAHSLPDLCRGGALDACDMIATSSGSTGVPAIWPRFVTDEIGTAFRFEQVLHDAFEVQARSTLGVICFALGSWVGGMYTAACCRHLAAKGYPLTLATPGNQKAEILRVLAALRDHYEQVVLFGYPPFLKDVIDSARAEGFDWQRKPVRLVMAGEVFSEEWRTLVCERLGGVDPVLSTASLYGTADGGVLANETPLSITIRRFLARSPDAARELFGESRLPTLCQYDPLHRYFEREGEELVFSGDNGVPLVRYKILDHGGVIGFEPMLEFLSGHGFDPVADLARLGPVCVRKLPFVYVFGRSSFALSYYGANVYPENVSVGLEQAEVAAHVTGKFVMQVARDADLNAVLDIIVELAPGSNESEELAAQVASSIRAELERLNSEFKNYAPPERRTPSIRLLPHGEPEHFPIGVKHRYVKS